MPVDIGLSGGSTGAFSGSYRRACPARSGSRTSSSLILLFPPADVDVIVGILDEVTHRALDPGAA